MTTKYVDGWDSALAWKLLKECKKGSESQYYGYCSLLMNGQVFSDDQVPPFLAPDAIRHWTDEQKAQLASTRTGERLVELHVKQQATWKRFYDESSSSLGSEFSWEHFQWAMEAVHSRAYKGDFGIYDAEGGSISFRALASTLTPVAALATGYNYIMTPNVNADGFDSSLAIAGVMIVISLAPLVLNAIADSSEPMDAVLLPLIDSANHKATADSNVEYDPFQKKFSLTIGKYCLEEEGDQIQLYTTYGAKQDEEWLLNYGFMPNVSVENSDDGDDRRSVRTRLVQAYHIRNP